MEKFIIGNFNRKEESTVNVIDIVALMKEAGADGFKTVNTKSGERVFLCKGKDVLPINSIRLATDCVRPTADLYAKDNTLALRQLIDNNNIYWGRSSEKAGYTGNFWMCFSKPGTLQEGVVTSFADIMKATGATKAELEGAA